MKRLTFSALAILLAVLTTRAFAQQGESPMPALPPDVPKDAVIWLRLMDRKPTGQDAVWTTPDGAIHEFYQYNHRGRGPKTYSTYRLDNRGFVTYEETHGVDYMKNPVDETFSVKEGVATWKNQAENDHAADAANRYFVDLDGGPQSFNFLVRALLNNSGKLQLLPGGEATIRKVKSLPVDAGGKKVNATLYAVDGLYFTPAYIWLDDTNNVLAAVGGWSGMVREGFEGSIGALIDEQEQAQSARAGGMAKQLIHHPSGDLVIKNVTVFDSVNANKVRGQRVTVREERIVSVEAESGQPTAAGAQVIDGTDKMLLPGLWDMHQHIFPDLAVFDVASGITTARDLANSIEDLGKLNKHIEQGEQIGPRIVLAGFIDGPGPYEGPVKVLAATPVEARQRVDD